MIHRFITRVDYKQWYLEAPGLPVFPDTFGDEKIARADTGFIITTAAFTARMPIAVQMLDHEPAPPGDEWVHVVEASLPNAPLLIFAGWSHESIDEVPVPFSDPMRLRFHWKNLEPDRFQAIYTPDGHGALVSTEEMRLQIWPAPEAPLEVIRWHPALQPPGHHRQ